MRYSCRVRISFVFCFCFVFGWFVLLLVGFGHVSLNSHVLNSISRRGERKRKRYKQMKEKELNILTIQRNSKHLYIIKNTTAGLPLPCKQILAASFLPSSPYLSKGDLQPHTPLASTRTIWPLNSRTSQHKPIKSYASDLIASEFASSPCPPALQIKDS